MTLISSVRTGFLAHFGEPAEGICHAPGRVNLIGDHVDYNAGLVLPMPISAGTAIAWARTHDDQIDAVALGLDGQGHSFALGKPDAGHWAGWQCYLRGMAAAMAARGLPVAGARLAIAGNLPQGAGLSSSASLCIAVGRALASAAGAEQVDPVELALAAQQAEHDWAGVNCGIMDQLAISAGQAGMPLLIDCQTLATRPLALPPDWAVLITQSGVRRGLVDGEYNARRADCAQAAALLGLESLREAEHCPSDLDSLEPKLRARARHVITEIGLVTAAVGMIERADLPGLGRLMAASHSSLRDDFEVSHPDVDRLVNVIQRALGGHGGARMTGGGFGGAVVAILESKAVPGVCAAIRSDYRPPGGAEAEIIVERPRASATGTGDG